ncbi:MAG: hypothetical protein D6746_14800 [Bacteroidetes bacterium]|nr:MAG: hypothetical protein D6746_14800 [Bacteroidota bacterium]
MGRRIVELVAEGHSIKGISMMDGMPNKGVIWRWRHEGKLPDANPEMARFSHEMDEAMEQRADVIIDECQYIADDDSRDIIQGVNGDIPNSAAVQRAKLRIDARKALAAYYARERYGKAAENMAGGSEGEVHRLVVHVDPVPLDEKMKANREGEEADSH